MMYCKKSSLIVFAMSMLVGVNGFGMENEDGNKPNRLPIRINKDSALAIADFVYDHPFIAVCVPFYLSGESLMAKARIATWPRLLAATFTATVALKTAAHYAIADKVKHDHMGLLFDYNNLLKKDTCRLIESKKSPAFTEKK